jgi:drug/metabolite transporter (DMT)-like permease
LRGGVRSDRGTGLNPEALLRNWRPIAALVVASFAWGFNWVVMKTAMQYAGPFEFCVHRALVALVPLFAILAFTGRARKPVPWGWIAWLSVFQTLLWGALTSGSVITGAAGTSSILCYTMPFWVMLLAWPILGERLRGWQWMAVALAAAGLLLVLAPWDRNTTLLSNLFATGAGLAWAIAAIITKRMRAQVQVDLWSINAWNTLIGTVFLIVIALLVPERQTEWSTPYILAVLYNAFIPLTLCWFLWLYALDRLVAPVAGLATMMTPVIAIALGWLLLDESPARNELAGMVLIMVALAQLSWIGLRREAARA